MLNGTSDVNVERGEVVFASHTPSTFFPADPGNQIGDLFFTKPASLPTGPQLIRNSLNVQCDSAEFVDKERKHRVKHLLPIVNTIGMIMTSRAPCHVWLLANVKSTFE